MGTARIFSADHPQALDEVAALLRAGSIGAVPTETVYGLAADVHNPRAVEAVFRAKERPSYDPLIVHVDSLEAAESLAVFTPVARRLASFFWPGPLTLILEKRAGMDERVTSGLPTVAIRCPAHPVMKNLLGKARLALAAPSANPFGGISPTQAGHVAATLGDRIDFILDGGATAHGVESTIVAVEDDRRLRILRPGPVSREAFQMYFPELETVEGRGDGGESVAQPMPAPGLLQRHYSPRTPLTPFANPIDRSGLDALLQETDERARIAMVFFSEIPEGFKAPEGWDTYMLTEPGNLQQAGVVLYDLLHLVDGRDYAHIFFQYAPAEELGHAINDRLKRAAGRG